MSTKKTVSNTFTVSTVEDGDGAPYYFLEWFAWSNDPSTNSVTTAPTIGGTWATSIPAQGSYAYLWRKSIRYVWHDVTRTYSAEAAQYFRMSGLDGTSIKTRGQVANASSRGNGTATIITDSGTQTITLSDGDAVTQLDDGHLYQWITEGGGKWLDLGQFKGESGKTYYTHVAWATKVNYNSSGAVTSVEGFEPTKSPNDTTHLWMGVLVNEDSGTDSSDALDYVWSYTKGVKGEDSLSLELDTYSIAFHTDSDYNVESELAYTVGVKMFLGNNAPQTITSLTATSPDGDVYTSGTSPANGVKITIGESNFVNTVQITVTATCAKGSRTATINLTPTPQGEEGKRGKIGRFFYFGGTFDSLDSTNTFDVNDAQAPYFEHTETVTTQSGTTTIKRYHVFNYDTNGTYTMSQMWAISSNWNNKPWESMTNDFKYLITEAIFGRFAHFGSFIINDDWLISQNAISGSPSNSYTDFDPNSPSSPNADDDNFIPVLAINGLTGVIYINEAHVKGEIVSSSGNIGGFAINSKWLGNLGGTDSQQGWTYITKDGSGHFFNKRETNPWALRAYGEIELEGNGFPVVISNISSSYIMINGRLQIVEGMLRNTEAGDVYVDTLGLLHVRGNGGGPYFVTDEFGRVTNPSTAYTQDGFRQINVVRGNCTLPNGCPIGTVYYVKGTGSTTVYVTSGSNDWIEGWDDNNNKGNSVGIQSNSVQFVKTATHIWTMFIGI